MIRSRHAKQKALPDLVYYEKGFNTLEITLISQGRMNTEGAAETSYAVSLLYLRFRQRLLSLIRLVFDHLS